MKANKLIISLAAFAAGTLLSAQTVSFHGYMDYTNFAVGQEFHKADGGAWLNQDNSGTETQAAAEYGSFYNGRTELNMNVTAANFLFNVGIRLDASGNSWYNLYYDVTQTSTNVDGDTVYTPTPFHQMNMRVSFWNDQIFVYTGKFEEWNNGYIFNGYALGAQNVRDLASRSEGQHLTGVEFCPQFVNGLKIFAGLPILPISGNGVQSSNATNQWQYLYKKVKIAGQYKLPIGITFNAGWRPGTYYTGVYNTDFGLNTTSTYTKSFFGEAYAQADMPYLVPGVPLNATFDLRYRKNDTVDKEVFAYYLDVSGQVKPLSNLTVNFENRTLYADDHYIATNEKLLFDIVGLNAAYTFAGTPYQVGMALNTMYAQDANGSSFSNETARVSGNPYCDDVAMSWDWMDAAVQPGSGHAGRYFTIYGYPYAQKNFANGYARAGVELQYSNFTTSKTNEAFTFRVPVAMCFWF